MKKLLFVMVLLVSACNCMAQAVARNGNTFTITSAKQSHKADTLVTNYRYDAGEYTYPIIINKASGRCYIWRKSSKTGKMYKYYINKEIALTICKELRIQYKEK